MKALVKFISGTAKGAVVVMNYHLALKQQKIGMVKILKVHQDIKDEVVIK